MAPGDDERETRALRREIDEAIVAAREAQSRYQSTAARGSPPQQTVERLRSAAIRLHNILKSWRDSTQAGDTWDEYDLDTFGELLRRRQTSVANSRERLSRPGDSDVRLAVGQLDADQLNYYIDGLLQVAKDLGFAPETKEHIPNEIGTVEDVRWLLRARDQSKAIEELEPPEHRQEDDEVATDGGVAAAGGDASGPSLDATHSGVPFRGPFFQAIAKRKRQGRDAKIIVASDIGETGVGKSTCAYYLAHVFDTSPTGFITDEQATLDVDSFLNAYDELSEGSALIFDEAEQLTGRRAMRDENVDAIEKWAVRRKDEIISLAVLPRAETLDEGLTGLADFRVDITRRGHAVISQKTGGRFSGIYWEDIQEFEFPPLDETRGMQLLDQKKESFTSGRGGDSSFVREEEVDDIVAETEEKARKEKEKEIAQRMRDEGESIRDIADALDRSKDAVWRWTDE